MDSGFTAVVLNCVQQHNFLFSSIHEVTTAPMVIVGHRAKLVEVAAEFADEPFLYLKSPAIVRKYRRLWDRISRSMQ